MDNNWFKIWPSKMLSILSSLPTGEMRAHMTLLIMVYLGDGGLSDDDEELAFRSSLPITAIQALRPYFRFLGRCEGGRLYIDFAEDVIMERVEFAEKKANAAAQRWKGNESKAKQPPPENSDAQPKTALQSTAKQRKARQSTAKPYKQTDNTDIQENTDNANALSGAGAPTEPDEPPVEKPSGRKPDPLFHEFCSQFQIAHDGQPYAYKSADFVKLSELREKYAKAQPKPWEITLERFKRAAEHYFASTLATHTLADLCERFSTFWPHAIDRFGKPMGENGRASPANGTGTQITPPVVSAPPNYKQPKSRDKGDACDNQT